MFKSLILPLILGAMILGVLGLTVQRHLVPSLTPPRYLDEIRGSLPPPPAGTYLEEIQAAEQAAAGDDVDDVDDDKDTERDSSAPPRQFRVDRGAGLPSRR